MISIKEISEERGLEEEFIVELLNEFYDYTVKDDFPLLCKALEANDLKVVGERAHSIKGAANNLMLEDIARCSEEIVNCCKKKDDTDLVRLTQSLQLRLEELGADLAGMQSVLGS